jgi:isopentenyldiphosphate isomerase
MPRAEVPLVDESGKTIGYGDRWWTHRVREGPDGPIFGRKHVGITIACIDGDGRVLVQHRRHKIFDRVWSLSGDTHPYRMRGSRKVETLEEAARRCAVDDLGVTIEKWTTTLKVSYSARDPRDPRYCENELLHVLITRHDGPFYMNKGNVYRLRWAEVDEISKDALGDLKKEPIERKYAPWVHALFSLPPQTVKEVLAK